MRPIFTAALSLLAAAPLGAQSAALSSPDGTLLRRIVYPLPPFNRLAPAQAKELSRYCTRAEYDSARADRAFALEKLSYASDGLRVVAYWYAPAGAPAGRRPLVIYNRGSWVAGDQAPVLAPLLRRLARAGFVVLAPQYRGSDGGEGRDEMGGADVADVLNLLPLAARLPSADTSRIFMYGESRGGMMTMQAIRRGMPLLAAATVGAFSDFEATIAADERSRAAAPTIWPDFDSRREQIAESRSAIRWAETLDVPLLILHGGVDEAISPAQPLALAARLQSLGRPYELHIFAGGTHTLGERSRIRDSLVIGWFRDHLPE